MLLEFAALQINAASSHRHYTRIDSKGQSAVCATVSPVVELQQKICNAPQQRIHIKYLEHTVLLKMFFFFLFSQFLSAHCLG